MTGASLQIPVQPSKRPGDRPDDLERRRELGQFLTPRPVADLMASFFLGQWKDLELLDAGAGAGDLTAALVRRLCSQDRRPRSISVTAYELDPTVIEALNETLSKCGEECKRSGILFKAKILNRDFIADAVSILRSGLFARRPAAFNGAIVNPPYRKISSASETRALLHSVGIETSNLYAGFVALITRLLSDGGELVSITPRSFCNGPYFKPFRSEFLRTMSPRLFHVFESRSKAFAGDGVLQENLIVHAIKSGARPKRVLLGNSSGMAGGPIEVKEVDYTDVVSPGDQEQFIHLPIGDASTVERQVSKRLNGTLDDLGLKVSTGRVVDFRARPFLREMPARTTAPLIYPSHFNGGFVHWPKTGHRKPNAIVRCEETEAQLVPSDVYVLVKRFTAKEERRRLVACVFDPAKVTPGPIGFENHLNYFHKAGGLSMDMAKGLAAFLNSGIADIRFRRFSGHTQVNATDLRSFKYPTSAALTRIGRKTGGIEGQDALDRLMESEILL